MNLEQLRAAVIRPAIALLGAEKFGGAPVERLMATIAMQESGLRSRVQNGGPAHGLWQFEQGGGVKGVLTHSASRAAAAKLCDVLLYKPQPEVVYHAIIDNDLLAAGFSRLLLWTDPKPIPLDEEGCWHYYLRTWRPGKPHRDRWASNWALTA